MCDPRARHGEPLRHRSTSSENGAVSASSCRGRACAPRGLAMASPYGIGQRQAKMAPYPRPSVGGAHARPAGSPWRAPTAQVNVKRKWRRIRVRSRRGRACARPRARHGEPLRHRSTSSENGAVSASSRRGRACAPRGLAMASPYGIGQRQAENGAVSASSRRGRACAPRGLAMASPYGTGQRQAKMAPYPRPSVGGAHARPAGSPWRAPTG